MSNREAIARIVADAINRWKDAVIAGNPDAWADEGSASVIHAADAIIALQNAAPRELHCEDCDQDYTCWYADNDLWNAVMRGEGSAYASGLGEPFLCARCFLVRAEAVSQIARVTWPNEARSSTPDDHHD